eukprot:scaffold1430_cov139-Isochrysis_galbana.AAC.1
MLGNADPERLDRVAGSVVQAVDAFGFELLQGLVAASTPSPTGVLLVKPLEPDQRAEESLHAIVDWELTGAGLAQITNVRRA